MGVSTRPWGASQLRSGEFDRRSTEINRERRQTRNSLRRSRMFYFFILHSCVNTWQTEPEIGVLCARTRMPDDFWCCSWNYLEDVGEASRRSRGNVSFNITVG